MLMSVVVPVMDEESLVDELIQRVKASLNELTNDFEIIVIDDGSADSTWMRIVKQSSADNRVKGIKFSRNFGQHYAITAGIKIANGDWVIVMDGDLQDRPEVIPELYEKVLEGYDIVFVSRTKRPEKLYYLIIQKIFYFVLIKLSGIKFDSTRANFSIIRKEVAEAFNSFPEKSRFYSSTIMWLGFKSTSIPAKHGLRHSGKPSYTLRKRFKLAMDVIIAFSDRPLKASILLGFFVACLIFLSSIYNFPTIISNIEAPLFLRLEFLNLLTGGSILLILMIFGLYIQNINSEVKRRPLYIISKTINIK